MEHIEYLSGENTLSIDNQQGTKNQVKEVKVLFMSEDITLEQLAEIIYNSYVRKYYTEQEKTTTLSEGLNKAA